MEPLATCLCEGSPGQCGSSPLKIPEGRCSAPGEELSPWAQRKMPLLFQVKMRNEEIVQHSGAAGHLLLRHALGDGEQVQTQDPERAGHHPRGSTSGRYPDFPHPQEQRTMTGTARI